MKKLMAIDMLITMGGGTYTFFLEDRVFENRVHSSTGGSAMSK